MKDNRVPAQLQSEHKASKERAGQQSCTLGEAPLLGYLTSIPCVTEP